MFAEPGGVAAAVYVNAVPPPPAPPLGVPQLRLPLPSVFKYWFVLPPVILTLPAAPKLIFAPVNNTLPLLVNVLLITTGVVFDIIKLPVPSGSIVKFALLPEPVVNTFADTLLVTVKLPNTPILVIFGCAAVVNTAFV